MTTATTATTDAFEPTASPHSAAESPDDLDAILRRLKAAARRDGTPSYEKRIAWLDALDRVMLDRREDLARAISRDFGNRSKYETFAAEIFVVSSAVKHAKAHLREWMEPEERTTALAFMPATLQVIPQPLGVVGVIAPWNYPVQLSLAPLVSILAAGNRAILKPSELVPETAALLRDLLAKAFSNDVVAVVTGGSEVGEAFTRLPLDHLVFTGSTRTGKLVMRAAAENLVPVTLELGGKSPAIVGRRASIRTAAERIMVGKAYNAGQTCVAPDYVFVPADARDGFVEACKAAIAKMYPTLAQNPDYTAIVNERHYARIRAYVDDAKARGATVVEINPANEALEASGRKIAPTLIADPTDEMLCAQEEIFGPVLPIFTYAKVDDALSYIGDRPCPLALYYFGHDRDETERVLAETISGGVTINETMLHVIQEDLPFGGVGASGMGHYHAKEGFETFSKKKPVFRQARINATGLLRPPYGRMIDRVFALLLRS